MIKKEIAEIKKQFNKDTNVITRICGCYIDAEKNIKLLSKEAFYSLKEEEAFKYEEIFRKSLSGAIGKNLLNIDIPSAAEELSGAQDFLYRLRNSALEDDDLLDEFYRKIITSYEYPENYYIILIDMVYDVPGKAKDGMIMEDASDNIYHAILCSICPVDLSKPGLSYDAAKGVIENRVRDRVVGMPMHAFLFPCFNDRSSDIHSVLYYSKKAEEIKPEFIDELFGARPPITAKNQKNIVDNLLLTALGKSCDYDTMSSIQENIIDMIAMNQESEEPLLLTKNDIMKVMSEAEAPDEAIKCYESMPEADIEVLAENIVNKKKFEVKTAGISIKADTDCMHLIKTQIIDGRKHVVIAVDDNLEINGIPVKA